MRGRCPFPFLFWSFITFSDHLVLNYPGIFSTSDWIREGKLKTFKLLIDSDAISIFWRTLLNSSKAVSSLGLIFGQAFRNLLQQLHCA